MAKRAAAGRDKVNMSQEIRALVEANNEMRGPDLIAALKAKFPSMTINENSVQVAFANIRKRMGLTRTVARRPAKRTRRASRAAAGRPAPAVTARTADASIAQLQAARGFLAACGDNLAAAQKVLQQLADLRK